MRISKTDLKETKLLILYLHIFSEEGRETMGCFFEFYKKCPKLFELAGMKDVEFIPGTSNHDVMNKGGLEAMCKTLNGKNVQISRHARFR